MLLIVGIYRLWLCKKFIMSFAGFILTFLSVGLIGKFPDEKEQKKYSINGDSPWWLPADDDEHPWFMSMLPALKEKM